MPRRSALWRDLPAVFARRMAPAAVLIALAIALAPPALFAAAALHGLRAEAGVVAVDVADALSGLATRQPVLWRYNSQKVLELTRPVGAHAGVAEVRVEGCDGAPWRTMPMRQQRGPAVEATAPIRAGGDVVARIRVTMGVGAVLRAALAWFAVSAAAGIALGGFAWRFPRRVVREQARALSDAGAALEEANRGLRAQVDAAVDDVRALSARVVSTQDAERERIARDLHDGVGQVLTALEVELAMARSRPDERDARLDAAGTLARQAMDELRHVVLSARPTALEGAPLPDVLAALAETFEARTGVACAFRLERDTDATEVDDDVAACLLRVAQEALSNITRHAHATEVGVVLALSPQATVLRIHDDGRGFDPAATHPGVGLGSMRDRVRLVGGSLDVTSDIGEGTAVVARVGRRPTESSASTSAAP